MLTKRQNVIETMKGGNPDRFVNSMKPFRLFSIPIWHPTPCRSRADRRLSISGESPVPGRPDFRALSRYIPRIRS